MKKQSPPLFRALVDRFTDELTSAIIQEVERRVAESLGPMRSSARSSKVDGRRGGRLCPVPGCGEPGAGPRNRWFCKNHAKKLSATEQKSILERNKRLLAEGKLPTSVPSQRIVRLPPKQVRARRSLDMSCRVEGCPNRSRGPRAGFICDLHRSQLNLDEQREARERWKARQKGLGVAASGSEKASLPAAVPPIVRKAEQA